MAEACDLSVFISKVPKINALSLMIGPPAAPPYWFFFTVGFLASKKLLAFRWSLRTNSHSAPWNWLVPCVLTTVIFAPGLHRRSPRGRRGCAGAR